MSELFIVIFASIGLGTYHILKELLFDSPKAFYFQLIALFIITILLLRWLYYKLRFKKALSQLDLDTYDFKFYKTCNSLFNKASYIVSSFLYNTISEYKFTVKDFSMSKNFNKDVNETEYYLKLRLRWFSYLKFTNSRTKVALRKADKFAFEHQNAMIEKSLSPEDREMYLDFKNKVSEMENKKLYIFSLRNLENYKLINYIYKYNLVRMYNNESIIKTHTDNLAFMNKKLEKFTSDVRTYKRMK